MEKIISYSDINARIVTNRKSILLLYKSGHQESECAYQNLELAIQSMNSISAYTADVNTVLDIHPNYRITSVPSLLIFDKGKFKIAVNGCQSYKYYKEVINNPLYLTKTTPKAKSPKRVTVYSMPTCSWCCSLKTWLKRNGIVYTDIDISRNEKAAQDLIKRSGQRGVPQTEIKGQIVIGFNVQRLKELLEIK